MQNLTEWREYWEGLAGRLDSVTSALAVTLDDEMAKHILKLQKGSTTLFYLPPSATSAATTPDDWRESNDCVIFIMEKYDPQRRRAYEVLETSQKAMEEVKQAMLADMAYGCPVMRVDVRTMNTMPETQFYAGFAGWSLGFKIIE